MSDIASVWGTLILEVIRKNPGISKRRIAQTLKGQRAPGTVYAELALLEREGLILVERGRRGQPSKYKITASGAAVTKEHLIPNKLNRGMVEIGFSPDAMKDFDPEIVELLAGLENNPRKIEIMNLYASTLKFILKNALRPGGSQDAEYIPLLNDALFYITKLPDAESQRIRGAVEFGAFDTHWKALDFAMGRGLRHLKDVIEAGLYKNPDTATTTFFVTKYDPKLGFVDATKEMRDWLQVKSPEEVKTFFVERLRL